MNEEIYLVRQFLASHFETVTRNEGVGRNASLIVDISNFEINQIEILSSFSPLAYSFLIKEGDVACLIVCDVKYTVIDTIFCENEELKQRVTLILARIRVSLEKILDAVIL